MRIATLLLLFLTSSPLIANELRTWTSKDGRTTMGELILAKKTTVTIRLQNGTKAVVDTASLSLEDQQYVKGWKPKLPIYVPKDAVYANGSWYKVYITQTSWKKAKQEAEALEGHLAWVKDEETQALVAKLADGLCLWLGASDDEVEKLWKWTDGEKIEYQNWLKGEPNNTRRREHYLGIWDRGKWNDFPENSQSPVGYVVQWDL